MRDTTKPKRASSKRRFDLVRPMLEDLLPGWSARTTTAPPPKSLVIGILPGEGIGPEVTAAAVHVLGAVLEPSGVTRNIRYGGPIGKTAKERAGKALTTEVVDFCRSVFAEGGAILCGPGGGRFVYDLRAQFDLYCKLTPICPIAPLRDIGPLRHTAVEGVDMVIVRENTSGLYFGTGELGVDEAGGQQASHTFTYREQEIRRIVEAAARLAGRRRQRLALVLKRDAIGAASMLWAELFTEMTEHQSLQTQVLEVDNAAYQIIAFAREFDVIVTPNYFGDVLGDSAALLLGSRGMSFSGNFGINGIAVYQTGHGAAYNLAGRGVANPLGQILSAAMMLRESYRLDAAAVAIEAAVASTLAANIRTADIAGPKSTIVGTEQMGWHVVELLRRQCSQISVSS